MTRGDKVTLTWEDQTVPAVVVLTSSNGASVFVAFDGVLCMEGKGAFFGAMALLRDDDGTYRDLFFSLPATIEPVPPVLQ